jgi:hypothetical protein
MLSLRFPPLWAPCFLYVFLTLSLRFPARRPRSQQVRQTQLHTAASRTAFLEASIVHSYGKSVPAYIWAGDSSYFNVFCTPPLHFLHMFFTICFCSIRICCQIYLICFLRFVMVHREPQMARRHPHRICCNTKPILYTYIYIYIYMYVHIHILVQFNR